MIERGISYCVVFIFVLLSSSVEVKAQEIEIYIADEIEVGSLQKQGQGDVDVGLDPLVACFLNGSEESCSQAAPFLSETEFESSVGQETLEVSVYLFDDDGNVVEKPQRKSAEEKQSNALKHATAINITVEFDYNSDQIKNTEIYKLSQIAGALMHPSTSDTIFALVGHTDSKGSYSYNCRLSLRRAISVRSYLATQGVQKYRLIPFGAGEALLKPGLDSNSARNRRVGFMALDQTEKDLVPALTNICGVS